MGASSLVKNLDWELVSEDGVLKLRSNDGKVELEITKSKLFSLLAIIEEARKYV